MLISIHAPIVGCDLSIGKNIVQGIWFQSTHPSWGATKHFRPYHCYCQYFNPRTHRGVRHSIDTTRGWNCVFQSTHPSWGATLISFLLQIELQKFQSTHPSWGATFQQHIYLARKHLFQSTHPSWGATISLSVFLFTLIDFNPRTHRGVRLSIPYLFITFLIISIHAPIVGCDLIKFKPKSTN